MPNHIRIRLLNVWSIRQGLALEVGDPVADVADRRAQAPIEGVVIPIRRLVEAASDIPSDGIVVTV